MKVTVHRNEAEMDGFTPTQLTPSDWGQYRSDAGKRLLLTPDSLERLHLLDPATVDEDELRAKMTHIAARISVLAHAFQIALH